jgi:predicted dithiol-disulfide oxidoreductase (DUF899 family)
MGESLHNHRFPGETEPYRAARNELLRAEMDLRRTLEEVAAVRRKLPLGGRIPQDYVFDEGAPNLNDTTSARQTRLSQLFTPGKDTLLLYSYMFGPKMAEPCVSCSSIVDGLDGTAPHVTQILPWWPNLPLSAFGNLPASAAGVTCGCFLPPTIPTTATTSGKDRTAHNGLR